MDLIVGSIVDGKVTGITKFGAFVTLPGGSSGLVHISEIANAYVNDVSEYLSMGQTVSVKVLSITPEGKINLSVKQALDPAKERSESSAPRRSAARPPRNDTAPARSSTSSANRNGTGRGFSPEGEVHGPTGDSSFEDKLKQFMQESDSRMNGNKLYENRKGSSRRRK